MDRNVLTDGQWAKMEPHCLGKPTDPGRSGSDNRRLANAYGERFIDIRAELIARGSTEHDLPPACFRVDEVHLNRRGKRLVARIVYRRMQALGWTK
jgi:lysophospholipase L1-like esterase